MRTVGGYPTVQICEPTMWHTVFFEFWLVVPIVFSLGGHTDTYRTVSVGGGAFELCLPSLGNFYQITTLRFCVWASVGHMTKVGHGRADV